MLGSNQARDSPGGLIEPMGWPSGGAPPTPNRKTHRTIEPLMPEKTPARRAEKQRSGGHTTTLEKTALLQFPLNQYRKAID